MTAPRDRTGEVVGRLTLVRRVESNRFGHAQWLCRCECGNDTVVSTVNLKSVKCCGCLRVVHHQSRTPDWNRWNSMVARCHCATSRDYPRYGGRGITVCDRWRGAQGKTLHHRWKRGDRGDALLRPVGERHHPAKSS